MSLPMDEYEILRNMVCDGKCPVCQRKFGVSHKRGSVRNHIKDSRDAEHKVWVSIYYKHVFARGHYCYFPWERNKLVTELRTAITKYYGDEILRLLASTVTSEGGVGEIDADKVVDSAQM
jgi:hypothetical protein